MKLVAIGAHLERGDVEPLARAVPAGDLFLSALEVADDQPMGDRELLVRVAGIRGQLLERATFVAIRYGFTFFGEAEAMAKVGAHLVRWRALLEDHRQHVEMTLKVAAASAMKRPDRREFTSGADYLRALQAARDGASIDAGFRAAVERLLLPHAIAHRWSQRDEKSIELAVLVRRDALDDVRAAGEELRGSSVPFLFSGPWPLEVFADADQQ